MSNCQHLSKSEQIRRLKIENQNLIDKISILKLKIEQHDIEARRYKDQLRCLQLLVKR